MSSLLIADRIIFSLLNKNIITEDDFEEEANRGI
ncbi:CRISPR-associated endonuclease Cas1 [Listeria marthii]|nr:CRISPR-associated endonuclease Cas1 [Listeria marthii]